MALRRNWYRLKTNRYECKDCGAVATWGVNFYADTEAEDRPAERFCDVCKPAQKFRSLNPVIGAPSRFHNEFGRSNSDVQSPVSQSIRNWGTKIKARTA